MDFLTSIVNFVWEAGHFLENPSKYAFKKLFMDFLTSNIAGVLLFVTLVACVSLIISTKWELLGGYISLAFSVVLYNLIPLAFLRNPPTSYAVYAIFLFFLLKYLSRCYIEGGIGVFIAVGGGLAIIYYFTLIVGKPNFSFIDLPFVPNIVAMGAFMFLFCVWLFWGICKLILSLIRGIWDLIRIFLP